jgi:hypothetical protein
MRGIDLMHNEVPRLGACEECWSCSSSRSRKISIVAILNCLILPGDDQHSLQASSLVTSLCIRSNEQYDVRIGGHNCIRIKNYLCHDLFSIILTISFLLYSFAVLTECNLSHLYNEWCHTKLTY